MEYVGRGKNKIQNPYTIHDFYRYYKEQTNGNKIYKITYDEYKEIVYAYFKKITEVIIEDGEVLKLPMNLGTMFVNKKKMNFSSDKSNKSIDWENTRKYGKVIFHTNDHSDNYKYRFGWSKQGAKVINIRKYRFVPTRNNKRRLAHIILNKIRDYFEV